MMDDVLITNAKTLSKFDRLLVVHVQHPAGVLESLEAAQVCTVRDKTLMGCDLNTLPTHSLLRKWIAAAWVARGAPVVMDHGAVRVDTFGFGGSVPQPPAHFAVWVYASQAMYDDVESLFLTHGKPARHLQLPGGRVYSAPYFAIKE